MNTESAATRSAQPRLPVTIRASRYAGMHAELITQALSTCA